MKKIISYFLSGIVLCTALLVTHVSAAEVAPAEETITINSTVSVRATNYWTKTTTKLNSVYGTVSNISTVSSGSVSGSNPQILKIEVYSRVSSGKVLVKVYLKLACDQYYIDSERNPTGGIVGRTPNNESLLIKSQ